jgi:hypothetical protein
MVTVDEVFLPYLQSRDGRSMYQLFVANEFKMLAAPEGETS